MASTVRSIRPAFPLRGSGAPVAGTPGVQDWRDVRAGELAACYEEERRRWDDGLSWDLQPALEIIEQARLEGRLPGLVARDGDGEITGWTFFHPHRETLQIGGLVARSGQVARSLLDAALLTPEGATTRRVTAFVLPGAPFVEGAFARRRFRIRKHLYLSLDLSAVVASGFSRTMEPPSAVVASGFSRTIEPWSATDAPLAVRLLWAAYAGVPSAECFVAQQRTTDWAEYLGRLLRTPGCGVFLPEASVVVREAGPGSQTLGMVLTTTLGPRTAHLAQVAVDPRWRGQGMAAALVERACEAAARAGCTRATLLVAEDNPSARSLYARLGFTPRAEFLFGTRTRPNRAR